MHKTLDQKLEVLRRNPAADEFILADAKDADMAFGIGAPGLSPESHPGEARVRTLAEYRATIREVVRQQLVDIMLMSASTNDVLTIGEGLFRDSPVTPAARANDTTDVWVVRGGKYLDGPAQTFRSASLDHIQCGKNECAPGERHLGANLGLYSVTFTNRTDDDMTTLNAFKEFRTEAEQKGFRYFLEVFDPNVPAYLDGNPNATWRFVNDMIARCLAGVAGPGRPQFLKIVYHGPQALEELVRYDPNLIVGILGGGAGTTYDAFKLLAEARKYGARVALYGRKINNAENQFAFIRFLRLIADNAISPEDAVKAYHGVLQKLNVKPQRSLADDLILQTGVMSYGGDGKTRSLPGLNAAGKQATTPIVVAKPAVKPNVATVTAKPLVTGAGLASKLVTNSISAQPVVAGAVGVAPPPDKPVGKMTSAERLAYFRSQMAARMGEIRWAR